MAYLEREDGHRVYYEDNGSGEVAVVLIHGWGMSLRMWDYSLPRLLGAGYRVVALDHRGCGQTDRDFDDLGIDAIAGDGPLLAGADDEPPWNVTVDGQPAVLHNTARTGAMHRHRRIQDPERSPMGERRRSARPASTRGRSFIPPILFSKYLAKATSGRRCGASSSTGRTR